MGTEFQWAVDLLGTSTLNLTGIVANLADDWGANWFLEKGVRASKRRSSLDKIQPSMDRLPEQHSLDSIKRTMLMQEDTFKRQVQELHRLYSVQKMLMAELRDQTEQAKFCTLNTGSAISGNKLHYVQIVEDNPALWRQQASYSGDDFWGLQKGSFDLGRPSEEISTTMSAVEDEMQAGPSSRRLSNCNEIGYAEEAEVELTLSIGGSMPRSRPKSPTHGLEVDYPELRSQNEIRQLGSSFSFSQDGGEGEHSEHVLSSSSATSLDMDRQQPYWLFQGLSLNRM